MGRPRKDELGPDAEERMKEAFWDALADMPFHKVTVAQITGRSGVNRNTFYYHFEDMRGLALAAIGDELGGVSAATELLRVLCSEPVGDHPRLEAEVERLCGARRMDRALLLCGPHGTPELLGLLRDALRGAWLAMLGRSEESLGLRDQMAVDFMLGGVVSMLPRWADTVRRLGPRDALAALPIRGAMAHMMLAIAGDEGQGQDEGGLSAVQEGKAHGQAAHPVVS